MRRFARRRPYLLAIVAVALVVVLVVGGRAAWRLGHRLAGPPPPPRQTDVTQIADWMSVPYVSRAYRVPDPELYKALGVEPQGQRMKSIRDIADEQGLPSAQAVEQVRAAVSEWQATHTRSGREPEKPADAPEPPWPPLPPQVTPDTPWPPSSSPTPDSAPKPAP